VLLLIRLWVAQIFLKFMSFISCVEHSTVSQRRSTHRRHSKIILKKSPFISLFRSSKIVQNKPPFRLPHILWDESTFFLFSFCFSLLFKTTQQQSLPVLAQYSAFIFRWGYIWRQGDKVLVVVAAPLSTASSVSKRPKSERRSCVYHKLPSAEAQKTS